MEGEVGKKMRGKGMQWKKLAEEARPTRFILLINH